LLALDQNPGWLVEDSWVIVQIDKVEYEELMLDKLRLFDSRIYGNTGLYFYSIRE
jgi:hypothetical protein